MDIIFNILLFQVYPQRLGAGDKRHTENWTIRKTTYRRDNHRKQLFAITTGQNI